jgi:uncharacterized membrane protein YdjX (TVP38/TMEM64 family)
MVTFFPAWPDLPVRDILRPVLIVALVFAVPLVPFLFFGQAIEERVVGWIEEERSREAAAWLVFGLLATDIALPVPSSAVSTWGGGQLGALWGTLVSWAGMTTGAVAGFALARTIGPPVVRRLSSEDDLARAARMAERHGAWLIVLARAVPLLAEASVLYLGLHAMSWRRFLPPLVLANLGIALAYSALGEYAAKYQALPAALAVSIAVPVLAAAAMRLSRRAS